MQLSAKKIDFTKNNIVSSIVVFSIPIVAGELLQNLYNSIDALVVGNLVSEQALAAVTVSGTISNLVISFFNGMSIGTNVVISNEFGKGSSKQLKQSVQTAYTFSLLLGIAISMLGILFSPQLLGLAGVRKEYYYEAFSYLRIYLAGVFFTVIYNNGAGILRALGNSETPFLILVLSCVLNIVLDILFVAVFQLGVTGVAIATVLSQGVSAICVYRAINKSQNINCLSFSQLWQHGKSVVLSILQVGTAAGIQSAMISFSNIFVVRYMNLFDTTTVAGIGIAQRLDRFIGLPAKSFGATMTTYVSQNLGGKHYERIHSGKKYCLLLSVGVTLFTSGIIYAFAEQSVRLFNSDPSVVATGAAMLRVISSTFWIVSVREIYIGVLRGYGKNILPMILTLIGMVGCLQLYLAIAMQRSRMVDHIFFCYPIAWIAAGVLTSVYYLSVRSQFPGLGCNSR